MLGTACQLDHKQVGVINEPLRSLNQPVAFSQQTAAKKKGPIVPLPSFIPRYCGTADFNSHSGLFSQEKDLRAQNC
jgi:hypothetical protein